MADFITWITENYGYVLGSLATLVLVAEFVVRFTPTKEDDGFVERFGAFVSKVMDLLKVPNNIVGRSKDYDKKD